MSRITLSKQLEMASGGANHVGVTGVTGEQEYKAFDSGDYTIGADINNNNMSFSDVVAGPAPVVTATPPGFAGVIANNGTLIRKYTNLIRVWSRTAGVWAHSFDLPRNKYVFTQTIYPGSTALAPAAIPIEMFVTPPDLAGWTLESAYLKLYAGTPGDIISYDIFQNTTPITSGSFPAVVGFGSIAIGATMATYDLFGATVTGCGTCTSAGLFITFVASPPNYVT